MLLIIKTELPKPSASLAPKVENDNSASILDIATSPLNRLEILRELKVKQADDPKAHASTKSSLNTSSEKINHQNSTKEEIKDKFMKRRAMGLKGTPPELREDFKIKQLIDKLSPNERKNWNDQEIVTITRGVIFGLQACGVDESKIEAVAKFALQAIHEDSVVNRFMGPIKAAWNQIESAPLGTKLLAPLIMGGAVTIAIAGSIRGFFDKNFEQSETLGNSVGYYGSPAGASIMIKAKHPADLGFIVAHEVCHMMQNGKEAHFEYFSHVTHSAFLDSNKAEKGSLLWSWDDNLNAIGGKFTEYERFFPQSAAASSIFRTRLMLDGKDAAMKVLQELRELAEPSEFRDVYVKIRNK